MNGELAFADASSCAIGVQSDPVSLIMIKSSGNA